jgi:hypothetical protein
MPCAPLFLEATTGVEPAIKVLQTVDTWDPALNATPCPPFAHVSCRRDVGVAALCSRF